MRCDLTGNATTGAGGGIDSTGGLTITDSELLFNTHGAIDCAGTTTISGSTISRNTAGSGGGILNHSSATLTITDSTLLNNTATLAAGSGGGILNEGALFISGSTLSYNTAGGSGGGIWNGGGAYGSLTIAGCQLTNNGASQGGAIFAQGLAGVNVSGTTIEGNTASGFGGAIDDYSSPITLSGCTITANTAGVRGGGIYLAATAATAKLTAGTQCAGNTAPVGSGPDVDNLGTLYLDSTSTIGVLDGNPARPI